MSLSVGERLGPYEIVAQIGAGGMGEVYKARDTRLERTVAVKVSQEQFSERFEREARAVAALNHPNICQLYDVGPNYLVMELVEGSPIAPVDSPRQLLGLAIQIADGLAAAHATGLIHRDLKPDNILVTRDARVKILDFGLAKHTRRDSDGAGDATRTRALTDPGSTVGTVNYMSPEQARGETNLSAQSDQFSIGLVLYELAAGKRSFQRGSAAETMTAIIREDAEPLPPATPAPLRWVIDRLLSKEPADRYDSTRDLFRDLRHMRERLSDTTGTAQSVAAPPPPPKHRRLLPTILTTAASLAAAAAVALFLLPPSAADLSAYRFTPLSRQDATERWPDWSPDGKSIVFTTNVHGIDQVFTKAIDSPDAAQLTHAQERCVTPSWSRNGSTIYYSSKGGLWAVPASGGTAELVLDKGGDATIHPDGKTVVFVREGKLWLGSLQGEQPHEFGGAPVPISQIGRLRFSPDGAKLMVLAEAGLWILPYPSGTPRKIAGSETRDVSWMPDSRHVVETETAARNRLSLLDTDDGSRRVIYTSPEGILNPSVSPDGKRIAYITAPVEWDVLEISLPSGAVRTVMAGSGVVSWQPDWAPSGTHFLVATDRSGTMSIEDVSAGEGFSRRLATGQADRPTVGESHWSPDGTRFVFASSSGSSGSRDELMLSNSSGGRATPVVPDLDASAFGVAWSPDSQWIAYIRTKAGKRQIAKIRPGSVAAPVILADLIQDPSVPRSLRWSPTDDWILYPEPDGLSLLSPDGKTTHKLTTRKLQVYGFSRDGSQVFGILRDTGGPGAQWQLYSVDVKSGADKYLGRVDLPASADGILGFSLHPDGMRFLTSIAKWPFDIWMMEGFDQPNGWLARLLRR